MKTQIIPTDYSSKFEKVTILDPPRVVFGHSVLLPSFSISIEVAGLRSILSESTSDLDCLQIVIHDKGRTEYSIVRERTE